jgi:predicted CopG family antitoxin
MRTTIILEDELGRRLREQARREGKSFSEFLAEAGLRALEHRERPASEAFRLITFRGKGPLADIDLDRTGELVTREDVDIYRGE